MNDWPDPVQGAYRPPRPPAQPPTGPHYAYPAPYWRPAPPPPPYRRRRRIAAVAALALVAVLVGLAAGRSIWGSGAHLTVQPRYGSASGSAGADVSPYGDGSGSGYGDGSSSALSAVAAGLVDIDITIGGQGAHGAATGIVLTSNGEVLTNNHVVDGATSISATDVGNGKTYQATVVGYDRTQDIAVIQLSGASGLQTAPIGTSSAVAVGDQVVALGNAGGSGGAPSADGGSVIALDRQITASDQDGGNAERLSGLIQVDANVRPGDSGGALVDQSGKVIGVNTAASSGYSFSQAGSEGYAVPIDQALSLAGQITKGQASATVHIGPTAFLGIAMASSDGLGAAGGQAGVTISDALSGSPAAQAGLAAGDTIVSVNDTAVGSPSALVSALGAYHPGDKVSVGWIDQSGQQHSATVTLASGPSA